MSDGIMVMSARTCVNPMRVRWTPSLSIVNLADTNTPHLSRHYNALHVWHRPRVSVVGLMALLHARQVEYEVKSATPIIVQFIML